MRVGFSYQNSSIRGNNLTQRVFSGIQPSGDTHIGNYLGALRNWVSLQDSYDAVYCVVDLHAITGPYSPEELSASRLQTAKTLLAVGIDPDRSLLYYQSQVPQHAELSWLLGADTPMGPLNRMTQYKEKSDKSGEQLGLFSYPVLMAADILIHKVHAVPVGEDQTQHLELTRDIAVRFNGKYGETFPVPEQVTPGVGARVMSLQKTTSKMSKSEADPHGTILLLDDPYTIVKKLKRAVTDSGSEIVYDRQNKPGISNLIDMLSIFQAKPVEEVAADHADSQYGTFKLAVAEAVVEGLSPIRAKYQALEDEEVARLMTKGALDARMRAEATMTEVRSKMGLGV